MRLSVSRRQALAAAALLPMMASTRSWAATTGYDAVVGTAEAGRRVGAPT